MNGDGLEEETGGTAIFGIQLSESVLGIILAVVGLAAAAYLGIQFVKPTWDKRQALADEVKQKEDQLRGQGDIQAKIEEARDKQLEAAASQEDVLSMFASKDSLSTLLLDINQQIESRNTDMSPTSIKSKLLDKRCPPAVVNNYQALSDKVAGGFFAQARLKKFEPVLPDANAAANAAAIGPDGLELVQDGSLGATANGQVKRQTYTVEFEGNFNQTQAILRQFEKLDRLLLVKNVTSEVADRSVFVGSDGPLTGCQPEVSLKTSATLQVLLPLSPEEMAAKLAEQQAAEAAAAQAADPNAAPGATPDPAATPAAPPP